MSGKEIILFKRFLKEKGLYVQYIKNTNKYMHYKQSRGDFLRRSLGEMLHLVSIMGGISVAFTWNATLEGLEFWADIDEEWRKLIGIQKKKMLEKEINKYECFRNICT